MKNYLFVFLSLIILISCKTSPGSDREYDSGDPTKTYKLVLDPAPGSSYYYDIINESESRLEANDKKVDNDNKTTAGIIFKFDKDSAGNLLLLMTYDKLLLRTKNGDSESELDGANAHSLNPTEKMLGILKNGVIRATITSSGEIQDISGYKEMGDKIMAGFAPDDAVGRSMAGAQWEKRIGNGMIKNNISQLFKLFPDSSVHVRDTWKLSAKQEGEIPLIVKNTFTLKAITNDIAIISVKGKISSDPASASAMGLNDITTNLEGEQEGEFQMETKTGLLINGGIKATVSGTINSSALDRDFPVKIKTSLQIKGHRM